MAALTPDNPPERLTFGSVGSKPDNVRKARIYLRGWCRDVAGYTEAQERAMMRSVRMHAQQPRDPYDFRLAGEMADGRTFVVDVVIP